MEFKHLNKFLTLLNKNNSREWFEKNRLEYENLKIDFTQFLSLLIAGLSKYDRQIAAVEAKKAMFRINRDVRFSSDKSPYKTNFGASIKQEGKKSDYAGYYIHIEPKKSFLAGGLYLPEAGILKKVREAIDYDPAIFRKILSSKNFKSYFKELQGAQLKNPPKGFDAAHPALDLLKFKSFLMVHPLKN